MHDTLFRLYEALRHQPKFADLDGPSELARALNLAPQVVTNWKTRGVSKEGMIAAEELYGISGSFLRTGEAPMLIGGSARPSARAPSRGVPVVGEARLGDHGYYEVQQFERGSDGYLAVDGSPDDYALRCFGDSMRPGIKPGQYVIVKPKRKPKRRDTVSCETRDGRRMIKILNDLYDNGMVELTSVNEDFKPITLDASEINHLYYAIGPIPADFYQPAID